MGAQHVPGLLLLWQLTLLLVFTGLPKARGAAWSATGDDRPKCLDGALTANKSINMDGVDMPIGLVPGAWATSRTLTQLVEILLRDLFGYTTWTRDELASSFQSVTTITGCEDYSAVLANTPCTLQKPARSHAVLEFWTTNDINVDLGRMVAAVGNRVPLSAGLTGFVGWQGMCMRESSQRAAAEAAEVPLEYHSIFNVSWVRPHRFFDTLDAIPTDALAPCLKRGRGVEYYEELRKHDPDGFVLDDDPTSDTYNEYILRCWNRTWWLSPACRDDMSKCIPLITGGTSWGYAELLHKSFFSKLPVALATAPDRFWSLIREHEALFYCWGPEHTFGSAQAVQIIFPVHNATEWPLILGSTRLSSNIHKMVHPDLRRVAPSAHELVRRITVSEKIINELTVAAAEADDRRTGVCNWLRSHEDIWREWLPSAGVCLQGYGPLASSDGSFAECVPCRPGFSSVRSLTASEYLCEACPVGRHASMPLASDCETCPPGHYASENGTQECTRCPVATYQPEEGQAMCLQCPRGTTPFLGATAESDCSCPPGTFEVFNDNGTEAACQTCNEYMEACYGGEAPPYQITGYWIDPGSYEVFECASDESCPGGLLGTCPTGSEGRTCSKCVDSHYWNAEKCQKCKDGQSITPWLAAVVGIVALAGTHRFGNNPLSADLTKGSEVVILMGMAANLVFSLSVFSTVDIDWVEPLESLLEAARVLSLDLSFLGMGCAWASTPLGMYITYLTVPLIGAVICVVAVACGFAHHLAMLNTFGTIFYALFIMIALQVLMPFRFIAHPGGAKTLQQVPHIGAGSADHRTFVAISVTCCLLYLVSFIAVCAGACIMLLRNPSRQNIKVAHVAFRFLFFKFKPDRFYWGLLILVRSTVLATVPVVSPEHPEIQLFVFACLLVISLTLTSWLLPWRSAWMNRLDVLLTSSLLMVIFLGASLTERKKSNNSGLASFLVIVIVISLVFGLLPLLQALWNTSYLCIFATNEEKEEHIKRMLSHEEQHLKAFQDELVKLARLEQQVVELEAYEELAALSSMATTTKSGTKSGTLLGPLGSEHFEVNHKVTDEPMPFIDLQQLTSIGGRIRDPSYTVQEFRQDIFEVCPEMSLYIKRTTRSSSSGTTLEEELERTVGALFAVFWACRLDIDGKQGLSFGVKADKSTVQEVPSGPGFDRSDLEHIPWVKMTPEQRKANFYWTFNWDLLESLFIQAHILIVDSEGNRSVDVTTGGRLVAMLVLTVIHDIMKNEALCPEVKGSEYGNYKIGDVIHDHDLALAYVLDRQPHMLPSFMSLSKEQKRVVRFTQSDMAFNAGWLVQAEGPPGIVLRQFKEVITQSGSSPADVAFYFCHWVTDLAGAEPTPYQGSEKFAMKFPQNVLQGLLASFGIVDKLADRTSTEVYEDYMAQRWRKVPVLGPEPAGKDRIAKLRLQCMCQDELAFAEVMRVWDTELAADEKAMLLAEMSATGLQGEMFSSDPVPGSDIANPVLVYYGPAWMQRASKVDAALALNVLVEVYRAVRQKWPRRGPLNIPVGKTIIVRCELLKTEELSAATDRLQERDAKVAGISGIKRSNAPVFEVKVFNDVEGQLEWVQASASCFVLEF